MKSQVKTGILVHGKHPETSRFDYLMWGDPPNRLGCLPTMIFAALEEGIDNIGAVIIGTGATKFNGLFESEYIKSLIQNNLARLNEFPKISTHRNFLDNEVTLKLSSLVDGIICEKTSKNTFNEVVAAASIFADAGIKKVIQISCGSHLPRCVLMQLQAKMMGKIPNDQHWYSLADDTVYPGSTLNDVVVVEPPHRGDDPMLKVEKEIRLNELVQLIFKVSIEERIKLLKQIRKILDRDTTLANLDR